MGKKVLLTSVFKPCGVDDQFGRKENIPELSHNQLTHYQGIFSFRERYPSLSLHIIGANIDHPVTLLDWPTLKRFTEEIKKGYDYIGISFIQPNFLKMKKMVEIIKEVSPKSKIIIGGFGTMIDDIDRIVDADYICRGEGIKFMRSLLGKPAEFRFRHPPVFMSVLEVMGIPVRLIGETLRKLGISMERSHLVSMIATGVGCYEKCDFCSTGQFFEGGYIPFLHTGREIFEIMENQEKKFGVKRFAFVGDENFFKEEDKVKELHSLIVGKEKDYEISLSFSSANHLVKYDPQFLAEMGLGIVWIGIESKFRLYPKNLNVNLPSLVKELHSFGIKTVLSSILCLDEHTKENVWEDINWHLSMNPTFSQFAHLSIAQGTILWRKMLKENRILHAIPLEDRHGFKQIWFKHPHFTPYESEVLQKEAYLKDYYQLGPTLVRAIEVEYRAYPNLLNSKSQILKRRAEKIKRRMKIYKPILWAAERLVPKKEMAERIRTLRKEIEKDFGKMGFMDYLTGASLLLLGKKKEIQIRLFGDVIQPETSVTFFNSGGE
jgi:radical SAM superfamily enzyme YgiQ (UPF0313 family)